MLDNLVLIAVIIMIMWIGVLAYYLFTSRQQIDLQKNIESLRDVLDESEKKSS